MSLFPPVRLHCLRPLNLQCLPLGPQDDYVQCPLCDIQVHCELEQPPPRPSIARGCSGLWWRLPSSLVMGARAVFTLRGSERTWGDTEHRHIGETQRPERKSSPEHTGSEFRDLRSGGAKETEDGLGVLLTSSWTLGLLLYFCRPPVFSTVK